MKGEVVMEQMINQTHIIDEMEVVEDRIRGLLCCNISILEMIEFIRTEKNTIFYFDRNLSEKKEGDSDIQYAWIDSGYCYKEDAVFISMLNHSGEFCGHFVGTAKFLVNGLMGYNEYGGKKYKQNLERFTKKYRSKAAQRQREHLTPLPLEDKRISVMEHDTTMKMLLNKAGYEVEKDVTDKDSNSNIISENPKQDEMTEVTTEIYNALLYPSWKSIHGLDRYIKIMGRRIEQLIEQEKTEYFVKNKVCSVIVNSGLMNVFGKDYFILYRFHEKYKTYIAYKVMKGKKDYIENGFTKEQASVELKPIQFIDGYCTFFEATMDEFDINQECLIHIVKERRERFPENLQEEPDNKIVEQLMLSLKRGLQIQMRDHSYAKMSYSGKNGKLTWLLPLHVNADFTEEPELVMVICKMDEFYEVKTILPYDNDIKDRITALSLYSKLW